MRVIFKKHLVLIVAEVRVDEIVITTMSRINTINCVLYLFGLVNFLMITEANHAMLTVKITNGDEIIELNWQRTKGYLANENLPIWSARKGKTPSLIQHVMTEVNDFVMYQDVGKTSAVVYIKGHDSIYGVIDTRFYIIALPFNQLGPNMYHAVGGKYIKAREENIDAEHYNENYDILLSALLTNEEIEYVNFLIDHARAAHRPRISPKLAYNQNHIIPSTSAPGATFNENQRVIQNIDGSHQAPSNSFNSRFSTDERLYYIQQSTNSNSDIFHTIQHNELSNGKQHDVQNLDGTHQIPSSSFHSRILTGNTINNVKTPNICESNIIPMAPDNVAFNENQRDSHEFAKIRQLPSNIFYPEILVFIAHDVFNKNVNLNSIDEVAALVQQYLIYFNAIDMLFAKLATDDVSIHINIAGIVLEEEPETFPYAYAQGTSDHIDTVQTMMDFPEYMKRYRKIFSEDLFDFFFLSTSHILRREDKHVAGVARVPFEVYDNRKKHKPHAQILGAIVQQKVAVGAYIASSHEIAHLMSVNHDPPKEVLDCNGINTFILKCNAIMQEEEGFCQHCVKWSDKSIKEFQKYASTNRNRCFLMNYPRSLHPYDHPMPLSSPRDQCICYGFKESTLDPLYMNDVPTTSCNAPLKCVVDRNIKIPFPLDGTPCGPAQVCWRRQCLPTEKPAYNLEFEDVKENQPPKSPTQREIISQQIRARN